MSASASVSNLLSFPMGSSAPTVLPADTVAAIHAFWQAYREAEPELATQPLVQRVEQASALIERYLSGLSLELLGDEGNPMVELIITAHGSMELFPLLMQTAAAAPALQFHRVTAFRARSTQPDFPISMEGLELNTSDVLVACSVDDGQAALEIRFAHPIAHEQEEHARHMVFIMLDHVLGEYDFAVKVGAVDFVEEADDPLQLWTPLSELLPVFDRHWSDTMGRTGRFPMGAHDWYGMELALNASAAHDDRHDDAHDDGHEVPLHAMARRDTVLVHVNRSANAVAMRADLAYALVLDLEVTNREELATVQALQDQAGTLLQLSHIGILAYIVSEGQRRKAVYYVGDEAMAQQAIAPLLRRQEAASLQQHCRYDPSWSGYFEFAVHVL